METLTLLNTIAGILVPFCVLAGAIYAGKQLRASAKDHLINVTVEALNQISDEKFPEHEGRLLRHWVCSRPTPLTYDEYLDLDEKIKQGILKMAMAHDRVAFMINEGRGLEPLLEWQKHELGLVWRNLMPLIVKLRGEHTGYCSQLETLANKIDL